VDRVSMRPATKHNILGIDESVSADARATYSVLLRAVAYLGLAYVSFLHAEPTGELITELSAEARANGRTRVILNSGFGRVTQHEESEDLAQHGDAVAVGRLAISNPDLVRRWQEELPVTAPDEATFYTGGEKGYTDYPFYTDNSWALLADISRS